MDNGAAPARWFFQGNEELGKASAKTLRGVVFKLMDNLNTEDPRRVIPLGHGDPAVYPIFRTSIDAENAVVDSLRSGQANCYSPGEGIPVARSGVADYLNRDLPHKLTPDDVYLTVGANQGIEIVLETLARPGANILFPRPGFPHYEARAVYSKFEVRHFDLLPDKGWEIDLEGIEAMADEKTVAMVIINPNNPCGNVYTHEQLKKVAETARKLGILVISDEVYDKTIFGDSPFIPMGKFASIAPVITLGALSKGFVVPGWKVGWIAANDPNGILKETKVVEAMKSYLNICPDATTILQAALPRILGETKDDFFAKKNLILKENLELACDKIEDIHCIDVPTLPESCTYLLVKLDLSALEGIEDDMDFCVKLAKEENLIILPGMALGLNNWLRITTGVDPSLLEEGLDRLKAFYERHAKQDES